MSCDDMIGEAFIFLFGVVISSIFVPGFHFIGSLIFFSLKIFCPSRDGINPILGTLKNVE